MRRARRIVCALAGAAAVARGAPARAGLYAERVTGANAARRLVGGPDAIGGVDDWAFGNGTLCAVVSDPAHESPLSDHGGVLVDLGHCGRADDQWNVLQPLFNLSRAAVPEVREVHAEVVGDEARVVTRGRQQGVDFETVYALSLAEPGALRVRTVLERREPGEGVVLFGDIALHGNASLRPFTLSTERPQHNVGFAHAAVDPDDPLAMARAVVDADAHVLVGGAEMEPPVSYGFVLTGARRVDAAGSQPLPHFAVNGADFSLLAVAPQPFWLGAPGDVGLLQLAQTLWMDVVPGARVVFERRLLVGERADVASVLDALEPEAPVVRGSVDDPAAVLDVRAQDGAPATLARPDPDGSFAFRLLPGAYVLRVAAPGGRALERPIEVGEDGLELGRLAVGAPGRVLLPAVHTPVRLVFRGADGTPDPVLGEDLLRLRFGDFAPSTATLAGHVSLSGGPDDPAWLALPPGRYRVRATRGPEFDLTATTLEVRAGADTALDLAPPARAFATPGWISADLHVHSGASDDSAWPVRARVAAFAAEGVEVVVSTDHDRVIDYAPLIRALGLEGRVASLVGDEITSSSVSERVPYTAGHANAFPLPHRPLAYAGGAPPGEGRRLRDIVHEVRALGGDRIVQLNHPRPAGGRPDLNEFFTHLSVAGEPYRPTRPLDAAPNRALVERDPVHGLRDLDFDAVELMNGPAQVRYWVTRADWLSLLLQGERRTGTANSDSHRAGEILGLPRNYVEMEDDDPASFDAAAFVRAVREGRVVGSTGPWLRVRLGESGVGDRFVGSEGTLHAAVDAAPWVPVETLRVYVDGALAAERAVEAGARVDVPLHFAADAFVTVEVEGEPGDDYAAVAPGAVPFAFSNPIFVDADGDGRWQAPGLGRLPPTLWGSFGR